MSRQSCLTHTPLAQPCGLIAAYRSAVKHLVYIDVCLLGKFLNRFYFIYIYYILFCYNGIDRYSRSPKLMPCKIQILAEIQSTSMKVSHLKCNITLGEPVMGRYSALAELSWLPVPGPRSKLIHLHCNFMKDVHKIECLAANLCHLTH